jgi:uncharacterized protein (TIGR00661 family)
MRFFFIVQGEGRGHMTQALSLAHMLRKNDHEIVRVVVGRSARRQIPDFFVEGMAMAIDQIDSPNFQTDARGKSVKLGKSLIHGFLYTGKYLKSIKQLHRWIKEDEPDVIVNFYDFLGGIYNRFKRHNARFITLAHQYLAAHSEFPFPKGRPLDRRSLLWANKITAWKADKRLALSFRPLPATPGITIVPPLLRKEVKALEPEKGDYILVYMLNHGYADAVDAFHKEEPRVALHCFWDKADAPKTLKVDDYLTYHRLDGQKFLTYMAGCKGYLTTAGFESVCEAMYLGKPVLMMPVEGHYEQACNAMDGEIAGAGMASTRFDLAKLLAYIPQHTTEPEAFRIWCTQAESLFLKELTGGDN